MRGVIACMGGIAMKLRRRQFLRLAVGAAALPALPRHASALDYPTRPVRILVGFDAGSALDVVARLISQQLSERLGEQFVGVVAHSFGAGSRTFGSIKAILNQCRSTPSPLL
jgi:tripartite-type tricarboxylate transporter receptor subunit TctC